MNDTVTHSLTKQKIQQLLASVGTELEEDATQNTEVLDHDWRQPHYFSRDQAKIIEYFAERVTATASGKFNDFYHGDFEATVTAVSQHFASELLSQPKHNGEGDYYLSFATSQSPAPQTQTDAPAKLLRSGVVGIPRETAVIWTTELFGDAKSEEDSARKLSQFEESLLFDIASLLVEAFSKSSNKQDFHPAGSIVAGELPLELEESQELCKITLGIKKLNSENTSKPYFLMLSNKLEPVTGMTAQAADEIPTENISEAIIKHLQQMKVSVTAKLGSAYLTFEELAGLGADDILRLDRKVDEPLELVVEGLELLRGRPAKSAGKYAVTITETLFDNAR